MVWIKIVDVVGIKYDYILIALVAPKKVVL